MRFLLSASILSWVCAVIILTNHGARGQANPPIPYVEYVWQAVYKGYAQDFFSILVIVLAGGSLLQERSHGTVGFTLALPVSRTRLMATRAVVGLSQVTVLAFLPACVLIGLSPVLGVFYPPMQALQFAVLWSAGGTIIFAGALLLGTVVESEYSSWIASFLCMMLYSAAVNITVLQRYPNLNFFKMMSGAQMPYLDAVTFTIHGPLPWAIITTVLVTAVFLMALANRLTQLRDY
ncbi:MAG: hypothetical protein ABJF23_10565 [Bryobacteraceae bacterium]